MRMRNRMPERGKKTRRKQQVRSCRVIEKPRAGEYPDYAQRYIGLPPNDGMILKHFEENLASTIKFVAPCIGALMGLRKSATS